MAHTSWRPVEGMGYHDQGRPIGRGKMGDMCEHWGITPEERIDVVNKINSRAIVTHAKAQTLLWFGTMNV